MVSNLDQAVKFYTETLGLTLKQRWEDHYAEIETPGLIIGLHPSKREINVGDNMSIGFIAETFDQTVEELKEKGIEFNIQADGFSQLAHFTDPDNNPLYLFENQES